MKKWLTAIRTANEPDAEIKDQQAVFTVVNLPETAHRADLRRAIARAATWDHPDSPVRIAPGPAGWFGCWELKKNWHGQYRWMPLVRHDPTDPTLWLANIINVWRGIGAPDLADHVYLFFLMGWRTWRGSDRNIKGTMADSL